MITIHKIVIRSLYMVLVVAAAAFSSCTNAPAGGPGSTTTNSVGAPTGTSVDGKVRTASLNDKNHLSSANVPGTNNGRLACAWAVNHVVTDGLGHPVGGGLSTAEMADALNSGRGHLVSLESAPSGCIIISPTTGPIVGHVGILMDGSGPSRRIYSNSSANALYMDNFSVQQWNDYFKGKGLSVLVYELNN